MKCPSRLTSVSVNITSVKAGELGSSRGGPTRAVMTSCSAGRSRLFYFLLIRRDPFPLANMEPEGVLSEELPVLPPLVPELEFPENWSPLPLPGLNQGEEVEEQAAEGEVEVEEEGEEQAAEGEGEGEEEGEEGQVSEASLLSSSALSSLIMRGLGRFRRLLRLRWLWVVVLCSVFWSKSALCPWGCGGSGFWDHICWSCRCRPSHAQCRPVVSVPGQIRLVD